MKNYTNNVLFIVQNILSPPEIALICKGKSGKNKESVPGGPGF